MRSLLGGTLLGILTAAVPTSASGLTDPFHDATTSTNLDFVHFNGMSGELYFAEMMGAGAALADLDSDGDLDLYLVQGTMLPEERPIDRARLRPAHPAPLTDRLYRNDLVRGDDGDLAVHFVDVTEGAALPSGYGMGVAAGDVDGDGLTDLYVTRLGSNHLLLNRGGLRFEESTAAWRADDPRWSVSASFADLDRDGRLDLFVVNYVAFRTATHHPCYAETGGVDYCGPVAYPPEPDRLLLNRGNRFEDASHRAGIAGLAGSGLGVVATDFDDDGWLDLYVANDEMENRLWRNRGNGSFEDVALLGGCAVNLDGVAESSMGVDAGDVDEDGDEDLFVTHLRRQTNTLYRNQGGLYDDVSVEAGLGGPSYPFTAFGGGFVDLDADGDLDVLTVAGEVKRIEEQARRGELLPLRQPAQLFENLGGGRFVEIEPAAGGALAVPTVGRGATFGDLDLDGDVDVVVTANGGPARVLENRATGGSTLTLQPLLRSGADALGASALLVRDDGRTLHQRSRTDGSYASAREPAVHFGLGESRAPLRLELRWPDGRRSTYQTPPAGKVLVAFAARRDER